MENELKNRLIEVENQITNLKMLGECDDCIHILVEQKEWLEGMIINYCE